MSSIIENQFKISNSRKFLNSFIDAVDISNFYLFIGKPLPWVAEPSPELPRDDVDYVNLIWEEMLAMKRITSNFATLCGKKLTWLGGKYYDMYRSDYANGDPNQGVDLVLGTPVTITSTADPNYYVITDENNVYKCMYNRGLLGNVPVQSTVKPTGKSVNTFTTADGYRWKYMLTVSDNDNTQFSNVTFIPIHDVPVAPEIGDPQYTQWLVQEAAIPGSIEQILITNTGVNFSSTPSVLISPPNIPGGVQATANAVIVGGVVARINMTNIGSGYTTATATISGGGGTGALLKVMIAPPGGHGSNAVNELNAYFVMLYSKLTNTGPTDIPNNNEYRRIGLIKNPIQFNTTTIASSDTLSATPSLVFNPGGSGNFTNDTVGTDIDETITGQTSGAVARLVDWNSGTRTLRYIQTHITGFTPFVAGEHVHGTFGEDWVIAASGGLVNPTVQPYTGEILYVSNRAAIVRQVGQEETIRIVLDPTKVADNTFIQTTTRTITIYGYNGSGGIEIEETT